ncbi:MAG TPA: inositol monophosphatase family protein [Thermoanaerobaculia bacterium]|nr:inositol monophosphatase family protein [Thermoanaerobaculia bacterium]
MEVPLLETAVLAARAGGEVLLRHFGSGDLEVRLKAQNDYVTRADRESETAIAELIRARHPGDHVLGEEGGAHAGGRGERQWLIDPLDGTTNFLHGLPVFAVSVACREAGELVAGVVLDPLADNLFTAAHGAGAHWNGRPMRVSARAGLQAAFLATGYPFRAQAALGVYLDIFREIFQHTGAIRRCGSAALDLAYTAAGIYDGFFEFRLSPWDLAAGVLLIQEAGGVVSDLDGGNRFLASGNLLAGGPQVWPALRAAVARHASEAKLQELVPVEGESLLC